MHKQNTSKEAKREALFFIASSQNTKQTEKAVTSLDE